MAKQDFPVIFVRVTETIIGMTALYQFLGVFLVKIHALALYIGARSYPARRTFIWNDVGHIQGMIDEINRISNVTGAIGILNPQDEVTIL